MALQLSNCWLALIECIDWTVKMIQQMIPTFSFELEAKSIEKQGMELRLKTEKREYKVHSNYGVPKNQNKMRQYRMSWKAQNEGQVPKTALETTGKNLNEKSTQTVALRMSKQTSCCRFELTPTELNVVTSLDVSTR
jgi:hypothetical protein